MGTEYDAFKAFFIKFGVPCFFDDEGMHILFVFEGSSLPGQPEEFKTNEFEFAFESKTGEFVGIGENIAPYRVLNPKKDAR